MKITYATTAVAGIILISLIVSVSPCFSATDNAPFRVVRLDNGEIVKPSYEFLFQDIMHPDLDYLRTSQNLDKVVEGCKSEFDMIKRIVAWTVTQWTPRGGGSGKHGTEVISLVQQGRINGTACGGSSVLLADALMSLGIQSRFLGAASGPVIDPETGKTNYYAHAVNDVWSNDHQKWVYMDGEFDLYFEDTNGVPMAFWELQSELLSGNTNNVRIVYCGDYAESAAPLRKANPYYRLGWLPTSYGQLRIFHKVDILAANNIHSPDWQSNTKTPDGKKTGPVKIYYRPPVPGYVPFFYPHNHYQMTDNINDVAWNMYDCVIETLEVNPDTPVIQGDRVALRIKSFAPFIDCFLVSIDGGKWKELKPTRTEGHDVELDYDWKFDDGLNVFKVRIRNKRGRTGVIRMIAVSDDPFSAVPRNSGPFKVRFPCAYSPLHGDFLSFCQSALTSCFKKPAVRIELKDESGKPVTAKKLAVNDNGSIATMDRNVIRVFNQSGKQIRAFNADGKEDITFRNIGGIALDNDKRVYVSDADMYHLGVIHVLDANTGASRKICRYGSGRGELNLPSGMDVTKDGLVVVADTGNNRIQLLSNKGSCKQIIGPELGAYGKLNHPSGVFAARHGERELIYIADTFNHQVVVTDMKGKLVGWFGGYRYALEEGPFVQPRSVMATGAKVIVDHELFEYGAQAE